MDSLGAQSQRTPRAGSTYLSTEEHEQVEPTPSTSTSSIPAPPTRTLSSLSAEEEARNDAIREMYLEEPSLVETNFNDLLPPYPPGTIYFGSGSNFTPGTPSTPKVFRAADDIRKAREAHAEAETPTWQHNRRVIQSWVEPSSSHQTDNDDNSNQDDLPSTLDPNTIYFASGSTFTPASTSHSSPPPLLTPPQLLTSENNTESTEPTSTPHRLRNIKKRGLEKREDWNMVGMKGDGFMLVVVLLFLIQMCVLLSYDVVISITDPDYSTVST
ncbi:hypothetical protein P7C70_g4220, partial [Phenoliferia sp. Uapishka_3]